MKSILFFLFIFTMKGMGQENSVPYRDGMTLLPGQSTKVVVEGPVVTEHLFAAIILGGFDNEGLYDSLVTTHKWVFKWMNAYRAKFKREPCMGSNSRCDFYQWIRKKRIAELKRKLHP